MSHGSEGFVSPVAEPRRSRVWRVLGGIALVMATLSLGHAILTGIPTARESIRPFVHTGEVGDVVDARSFSAEVLSVHGGRFARTNSNDQEVGDTDGIFLLVTAKLTAYRGPVALDDIILVDDQQVEYERTARVHQTLMVTLEAGSPVQADVLFEIPLAAATSVRVRFGEYATIDVYFTTFADIRLGITQAQVEQWRRESTPLSPEPEELLP